MTIDPDDLEWHVAAIYTRAGRDPADPVRPSTLARALGIRLFSVPHLMARGESAVSHGERMIGFRAGLPRPLRGHVIAHELAHLERGTPCALRLDREEQVCDYIAAALIMPRGAFVRRLRDVGPVWRQLAIDFGVTETSAALRAGETEGRAIAVVTPQLVRARGGAAWPDETTIRRWARRPGPGVRSAKLTDDTRRHVVELDDLEEDLG